MTDDRQYKNNKPFNKRSRGGDKFKDNADRQHEPIQAKPLEVKVYGNDFEKALRAFRALVQKEKILSTYKEHQSYEKPSVKRRRKRNESIRKLMELETKEKPIKSKIRKNKYQEIVEEFDDDDSKLF